MGRIVVGVDGSPGSDRALAWAVAQAHPAGDRVTVVHVYSPPRQAGPVESGYASLAFLTDAASQMLLAAERRRWAERQDFALKRAEAVAASAVRRVVGDSSDVPVHTAVVSGRRPGRVLTEFARDARLLVVGSRDRGWVKERLLGSVSRYCVRHAPCPVLVVGRARAAASQQAAA